MNTMNIPMMQGGVTTISADETHLVREFKEMAEEKLAIGRLFPAGRMPTRSDFTPEIEKRLNQNLAHAELIFDELQGLPRERFLVCLEMIVVALYSRTSGH